MKVVTPGPQFTSSEELSVFWWRLEGGAEADLRRIHLLGGVLAFLEHPDQLAGTVAEHGGHQHRRRGHQDRLAGSAGYGQPEGERDEERAETSCHTPRDRQGRCQDPQAVKPTKGLRNRSSAAGSGVTSPTPACHRGAACHFRNLLKSTGRFSTNALRPSIASAVW